MKPRAWRRVERRAASFSCAYEYRSCLRSLDVAADWWCEWGWEPSIETLEPTDCESVEAEDSVAAVLGCEDDMTHGDRGGPPSARPPFLSCGSGLHRYCMSTFSI